MLDSNSVRTHVGAAPNYLLVLRDHLYSIRGKEAVDVSARRDQTRLPTIGDETIEMLYRFEDSGHEETIAGVTGKVFQIDYYDDAMQFIKDRIVLSFDARAVEMTRAWRVYGDIRLATNVLRGRDALQNYLETHLVGVLRFGNQYKKEAFGVAPAADRFQLPASETPPVLQPSSKP